MARRQEGRVRTGRNGGAGRRADAYGPQAPYSAASYAAEAYGSATLTLPQGPHGLRGLLMGSAAAATLFLSVPRQAYGGPQPCTKAGDTVICEGDQSAGISYNSVNYDTLVVQNLTADIAPAFGDGVRFTNGGDGDDVSVTVDGQSGPGAPHEIVAQYASGIFVSTSFGNPTAGAVDITSNIDITTLSNGIQAGAGATNFAPAGGAAAGAVSVFNTGDIDTRLVGIGVSNNVYTAGGGLATAGHVTIASYADVKGQDAAGFTYDGYAFRASSQAVTRGATALDATSGAVGIVSEGALLGAVSTNTLARSDAFGAATTVSGDATSGAVTIDSTGDLTTLQLLPRGIGASGATISGANAAATGADAAATSGNAATGVINATSIGDITAGAGITLGVGARSYTEARVYGAGVATASAGDGTSGAVSLQSIGDIDSSSVGLLATSSALLYAHAYASDDAAAQAGNATAGNVSIIGEGAIAATAGVRASIDVRAFVRAAEDNGSGSASVGNTVAGDVAIRQIGEVTTANSSYYDDGIFGRSTVSSQAVTTGISATIGETRAGGVSIYGRSNIIAGGGDYSYNPFGIVATSNASGSARYTTSYSSLVPAAGFTGTTGGTFSGTVLVDSGGTLSGHSGIEAASSARSFVEADGGLGAHGEAGNAISGSVAVLQDGDIAAAGSTYDGYVYRGFGIEATSNARTGVYANASQPGGTADAASGNADAGLVEISAAGDVVATNSDGIYGESRANTYAEAGYRGYFGGYYGGYTPDSATAQSGNATSGGVSVVHTGGLTADFRGIFAGSRAYSSANAYGLESAAASAGQAAAGGASIATQGDIIANDGVAIRAEVRSSSRSYAYTSAGGGTNAIAGVASTGDVSITQTGNVVAATSDAIRARSSATSDARADGGAGSTAIAGVSDTGETRSGDISIASRGDVSSAYTAIYANTSASVFANAYAQPGIIPAAADAAAALLAAPSAIAGNAVSGDVLVDSAGALEADSGITARSRATVVGSSYAAEAAAQAGDGTSGSVTVLQDGAIAGGGISADSGATTSTSALAADPAGSASSLAGDAGAGAVSVTSVGDITEPDGRGISGQSSAVTIAYAAYAGYYGYGRIIPENASAEAGNAISSNVEISHTGGLTGVYGGVRGASLATSSAAAYGLSTAAASTGQSTAGNTKITTNGDVVAEDGTGIDAASGADTRAEAYAYEPGGIATAAAGFAAAGDVELTHTGDVTTDSTALSARSSADSRIYAYGSLGSAATTGSDLGAARSGDVTLDSSGDVSARTTGIYAGSFASSYVSVTLASAPGDAPIAAEAAALLAAPAAVSGNLVSGNVDVESSGTINADRGLSARSSVFGLAVVSGADAAAQAGDASSGSVSVVQGGDVTALTRDGIDAYSGAYAYATATSHEAGGSTSSLSGNASAGPVTVASVGDVAATGGTGVEGLSFAGSRADSRFYGGTSENGAVGEAGNAAAANVSVSQTGAVAAEDVAVAAGSVAYSTVLADSTDAVAGTAGNTTAGDVTVVTDGNLVSTEEYGIYARSVAGNFVGAYADSPEDVDAVAALVVLPATGAAGETGLALSGAVGVTHGGNVTASYDGIKAISGAVTHTRTRAATVGTAVAGAEAEAQSGDVTVFSRGDVSAGNVADEPDGEGGFDNIDYSAIYAVTYAVARADVRLADGAAGALQFTASTGDAASSDVAVDNVGHLTADNGITAGTFASSNATVFEEAVDNAQAEAGNAASGSTIVLHQGAINALHGHGIEAYSDAHVQAVAGSNAGGSASSLTGDAGAGAVIVSAVGDIAAAEGHGILAQSIAESSARVYGSPPSEADAAFATAIAVDLPGGGSAAATAGAAAAGDVSVASDGTMVAPEIAIVALSEAISEAVVHGPGGELLFLEGGSTIAGDVSVESIGAVAAGRIGIDARSLGGSGDVSLVATGDVNVTGASGTPGAPGAPADLGLIRAGLLAVSGAEFGFASSAGATSVTVSGAAVTTGGDVVHGIAAFGAENNVALLDGASVATSGAGSAGILVGPQVFDSFLPATIEGGVVVAGGAVSFGAAASVNSVFVEAGSSVVSAGGIAILDNEQIASEEVSADERLAGFVATAQNQTSVAVGGTVSGAGTAIALNGADDEMAINPGFDITGLVDGGEGGEADGDRFALGSPGVDGVDSFDISLVDGDGTPDASDQYVNFENFLKQGPSTFTLVGDNPEILELPILGGELLVNGTLVNAAIPIFSGGLLGGTGTIGSFDAGPGAIVAPGASIGTLHVLGDGHFAGGSFFQVEVNANGTSDLLDVGGVVSIDGGTIDVRGEPGDYPQSQIWTVITAQAVTGTFDDVVDDLPDIEVFDFYEPDSVLLGYTKETSGSLTHKENAPASLVGAGFDALNFAETLQERGHFLAAGFSPVMPPLGYLAVPEESAGGAAFLATNGVADAAVAASPAARAGFGAWAGAFGTAIEDDGEDGFESKSLGLAGGVEAVLGDAFSSSVVGVAFGRSETDVSVTDGAGDVDGVHVGLYGAHQRGRLNVSAAAGYSWFDFDLSRRLDLGGGDFVSASAEADGHALSGSLQVSYDIAELLGTPDFVVAPTARLNAISAQRDGYTEEGADILDLTVEEDDLNQLIPAAGVSLGTVWSSGGLVVKPELQLLYEHVFGDADVTGEAAIPVADATFTSEVSAGGRNRLALGAGLGAAFSDTISAHIRYDGSLSGEADSHRASGAFSVRF